MKMNRREMLKSMGITVAALAYGAGGILIDPAKGYAQSSVDDNLITDHVIFSDRDGSYVESPDISISGNGEALAVWIERRWNDKDFIMFSSYSSSWSDASPAISKEGKYEDPRLACSPAGIPMLLWTEISGNAWVLKSSLFKNGKFDSHKQATSGKGKSKNPHIIALDNGDYWIAWESYRKGKFRVCLKRNRQGAWGREIPVTQGKVNAYYPSIAADNNGKLHIAYSEVDNGHQNIMYASYDPDTDDLSTPRIIVSGGNMTRRPNANSHPDILCDKDDLVWIAYERDANPSKGTLSYHGWRECAAVCIDKNGNINHVLCKDSSDDDSGVFRADNDHYPSLQIDGNSRLRLFSRKSELEKRGWNLRASCLNGRSGWTPPVSLLEKNKLGRLSKPALALAGGSAYWTIWQEDNFIENAKWIDNVWSNIHIAKINLPEIESETRPAILVRSDEPATNPKTVGRPWVKRRKIERGDDEYILLFGNLHEHTLLSRCWIDGSDGTLDENYRHGFDVEGYDFMAMTDHDFDSHEAVWRQTRRTAGFYDSAPHIIALPAYEWTLVGKHKPPSAGHRNIVFAHDEDAAKFLVNGKSVYGIHNNEGNKMDKVWDALRKLNIKDAVTIPHHPADADHPMDWDYHDDEYQSVVEIFQCRESAEYEGCPRQTKNLTYHKGCFVQDALARGYRMGFTASGDHNSMGIGLAAVYVKEASREGILEALKSRRCYGTTGDKIFIDFRINGHLMGEEFACDEVPVITAKIKCPAPIDSIVIFKNNKVIYEKTKAELASAVEYDVEFIDKDFSENSYYYIRAIQANNQIAWASPIWVNRI